MSNSNYNDLAPNFVQWARLKGVALKIDEDARAEQESLEKCTWDEIGGKPEEFTPSAHTHKLSEVTDYKAPDLSKYATINKLSSVKQELQAEIKTEVAGLVNGAPEALNTLKELSDAFGENANGVAEVLTKVGEVKASLADYALKSEIPTLPENHVTKDDLAEVASTIPSIEGLATETFVVEKIAETDHSIYATKVEVEKSVTGLASEDFVNKQILAVESKIPTIPTDHATKEELASAVATLNSEIASVESTARGDYATKTELAENMVNVVKQLDVTKDYVSYKTIQIGNKETISILNSRDVRNDIVSIDKLNYLTLGSDSLQLNLNTIGNTDILINKNDAVATKAYVANQIKTVAVPDLSNYAVKGYVDDAVVALEVKSEGLYAKKSYVDKQFSDAIPNVSNFVTKDELVVAKTEAIAAASGDASSKYATIESVEEVRNSIPVLPSNHATVEELAAALFRINTLESKVFDLSKSDVVTIVAGESISNDVVPENIDLTVVMNSDAADIEKSLNYTAKSVDIKGVRVKSEASAPAKVVVKATDGDVAITNYQSTGVGTTNKGTEISISSNEHVKVSNCTIGQNSYNGLEISLDKTSPKSVLIDNVKFEGKLNNNAISIFNHTENAVITISNCHFSDVSNALRISNVNNVPCIINVINCVVDSWADSSTGYSGFLICQDHSSASASDEVANNRFGSDKITVNFINCVGPNGKKFTEFGTPAEFCGTANDNQLVYVYYDKSKAIQPYGDAYPVINIK